MLLGTKCGGEIRYAALTPGRISAQGEKRPRGKLTDRVGKAALVKVELPGSHDAPAKD